MPWLLGRREERSDSNMDTNGLTLVSCLQARRRRHGNTDDDAATRQLQ